MSELDRYGPLRRWRRGWYAEPPFIIRRCRPWDPPATAVSVLRRAQEDPEFAAELEQARREYEANRLLEDME